MKKESEGGVKKEEQKGEVKKEEEVKVERERRGRRQTIVNYHEQEGEEETDHEY